MAKVTIDSLKEVVFVYKESIDNEMNDLD